MTHLNNCCPVERIDDIRLANGQRVVLRPALERDLHLHGLYFDGLSNESRYNRFFNPTPRTTAKMLRHLLHSDCRCHVALLAEHISGDKGMVIAEARYKVAENGGSAEFALSVADQFHGWGLENCCSTDSFAPLLAQASTGWSVKRLPRTTRCSGSRARPVLLSRPIRSTCTS
jgi:hypothetical protein